MNFNSATGNAFSIGNQASPDFEFGSADLGVGAVVVQDGGVSVPEPPVVLLLLTGMLAMAAAARRRRESGREFMA